MAFRQLTSELGNRGGIRGVIGKYGFLKSVDLFLEYILAFIVVKTYRPTSLEFGLKEIFVCSHPPYTIDWFTRNARVSKQIMKHRYQKVLDVGGGPNGIMSFLKGNPAIFIVDLRRSAFSNGHKENVTPIVADASHLPFKQGVFDVACGVSMLEHIPKKTRISALMELRRVGARVIVHLPVESKDSTYVGRQADVGFLRMHQTIFGFEEETTAEHVKCEHIYVEDLKSLFPEATFQGVTNYFVWMKYMIISRIPFCYLCGFLYFFVWKKDDNKPPYYEVMITLKS